jgi:hypothetical protein
MDHRPGRGDPSKTDNGGAGRTRNETHLAGGVFFRARNERSSGAQAIVASHQITASRSSCSKEHDGLLTRPEITLKSAMVGRTARL